MNQRGWVAWSFVTVLFFTSLALTWWALELKSARDGLTESLAQTENRLENRQTRLAEASDRAGELQVSLNQALRNERALQEQLNVLQQQLTDAESTAVNLTASRQAQSDNLQSLENQLSEAQEKITSLEGELQTTNDQLAAAQADVQSARNTVSALQSDLASAEATEEEFAGIRGQLALAQNQQADQAGTIEQLQRTLEKERSAVEALQSQLEAQALEEQARIQQAREEERRQALAELQEKEAESPSDEEVEPTTQATTDATETQPESTISATPFIRNLTSGSTAIQLPEAILFDTGSAELSESGLNSLQAIADALVSFPEHRIRIEGHTDARTITATTAEYFPSNWELGSARAAAAVRALIGMGVLPSRFEAVGLADTRPAVKEVDAQTRRQNRRIEILLVPTQ